MTRSSDGAVAYAALAPTLTAKAEAPPAANGEVVAEAKSAAPPTGPPTAARAAAPKLAFDPLAPIPEYGAADAEKAVASNLRSLRAQEVALTLRAERRARRKLDVMIGKEYN